MARLNFKEIPSISSEGGDTDHFEKFCQEFINLVLGMSIVKGPSRGADGGIDIGAQESNGKKWLVSCKHYAYSGNSVGRADEEDILDRIAEHDCNGFMGIYSTIPSSGLEQKLERLRKVKGLEYKIYNSEEIERLLLEGLQGFRLAKRFFPKSIQNVWPQIISLHPTYTESDAVAIDGKWIIPNASSSAGYKVYAHQVEDAVRLANEEAMIEIHGPMFLAAWKEAVTLFPEFFNSPKDGVNSAVSVDELSPEWNAVSKLNKLSPNMRWSVLAIWSLVDESAVREILKGMNHDASQQELDLMSFAWLAKSTATNRRDILTRLFAYCPASL